jgi:hypothetical protein
MCACPLLVTMTAALLPAAASSVPDDLGWLLDLDG